MIYTNAYALYVTSAAFRLVNLRCILLDVFCSDHFPDEEGTEIRLLIKATRGKRIFTASGTRIKRINPPQPGGSAFQEVQRR